MPRHPLIALLLLTALAAAGRAAPAGKVVINYWEKWGGFEAEAMKTIVADFNRAQDRIEVRFLSISPIEVKLLLATSAGNPPDLAGLWTHSIPDYAEKGALTPLDQALAQAGIGEDHYVPVFWELCRHKGFTWGLPTTPGSMALFYNKKLFREAGLDPDRPPRTKAELDEMSRKLTRVELLRDGRRVRLPFDGLTAEERKSGRYTLVQVGHLPADAGMYLSAWGLWFGAKYFDGDRRILATDAGLLAAYQWFRDIVDTYGLDALREFGASFGQSQSSLNPFLAGQAAMVLQGPWEMNFIEKFAPDLEWGVAACPAAPGVAGQDPITYVESDVIVIPRGAAHPREAFEFITYLQRQDVAEKLATLQRKFTALREVSPDFYRNHPYPAIKTFVELAHSPGARYVPRLPNWREYDIEMTIAAMRVRYLLATPAEALAQVQERVQWRYDRILRRWDIVKGERLAEWRDHERW